MRRILAGILRFYIAAVVVIAALIVALPALGVVLLEKKSSVKISVPVDPLQSSEHSVEETVVAPLKFLQNFVDKGWRN